MVDLREHLPVGVDEPTMRQASAYGRVKLPQSVLHALQSNDSLLRDVVSSAKIAGLFAAKRVQDFVPRALNAHLTRSEIEVMLSQSASELRVTATLEAIDRMNLEVHVMSAIMAASLAAYEILVAIDPSVRVEVVELTDRQGGTEPAYHRPVKIKRLGAAESLDAIEVTDPEIAAESTVPSQPVHLSSAPSARHSTGPQPALKTLAPEHAEGETTPPKSKKKRLSEAARALLPQVESLHCEDSGLLCHLQATTIDDAYMLGDLANGLEEHCRWFGVRQEGEISGALLITEEHSRPLLMTSGTTAAVEALFASTYAQLPQRFFAQVPRPHQAALETFYELENERLMIRMGIDLCDCHLAGDVDGVAQLSHTDTGALMQLQQYSPDNLFDPALIGQGLYCGLRVQGELVCCAGLHVLCDQYNVAALSSVVTHIDHRGQGYATRCLRWLLREVQKRVDYMALNVAKDNEIGVKFLEKFGFSKRYEFIDSWASKRPQSLQGRHPWGDTIVPL